MVEVIIIVNGVELTRYVTPGTHDMIIAEFQAHASTMPPRTTITVTDWMVDMWPTADEQPMSLYA